MIMPMMPHSAPPSRLGECTFAGEPLRVVTGDCQWAEAESVPTPLIATKGRRCLSHASDAMEGLRKPRAEGRMPGVKSWGRETEPGLAIAAPALTAWTPPALDSIPGRTRTLEICQAI